MFYFIFMSRLNHVHGAPKWIDEYSNFHLFNYSLHRDTLYHILNEPMYRFFIDLRTKPYTSIINIILKKNIQFKS